MHAHTTTRRLAAPLVVAGFAIALAACGSSGSSASSSSTTSATSGSGTPSTAAVVVKTGSAPQGTILVDSKGMTLYTLTNNGAAVACTGGCLTAWPPLLLPSGATKATGGSGVTGLAVVTAGAGQQVTEKGLPLYTFANDHAAGDANGEGISSFGGTWHVVKVTGSASSGGASTSTTAKSSGGY